MPIVTYAKFFAHLSKSTGRNFNSIISKYVAVVPKVESGASYGASEEL